MAEGRLQQGRSVCRKAQPCRRALRLDADDLDQLRIGLVRRDIGTRLLEGHRRRDALRGSLIGTALGDEDPIVHMEVEGRLAFLDHRRTTPGR